MMLSFLRSTVLGLTMVVLLTSAALATTISIINNDGVNEGLNDPTPVSAVPGNSATTLGAQYLNVIQAAADYWEERLESLVTIAILAELKKLNCSSSSGVLGSAGAWAYFRDFSGTPLTGTWYTVAQANSLAGSDLSTSAPDISMSFNNAIGTENCFSNSSWWLGIDSPAPFGTISFFDTVLHELAHGLGFASLVEPSGAKFFGFDDVFMANLFDQSSNKSWSNMTNNERMASSVNTGNLVWSGPTVIQNAGNLTSGKNGNYVRLYTPNPYRGGSSVSHWDTALAPDELMEPSATPTSNDCTTISAFKDMGWTMPGELSFTQRARVVFETMGSGSISVNRSSIFCSENAVSVRVSSSNGSALSGSDYTFIDQTLNWASGETGAKTINISVVDDNVEELGGETFTLNLSNPTGGAALGNITSATITIKDVPDDICFPVKSASGNIAVVCL